MKKRKNIKIYSMIGLMAMVFLFQQCSPADTGGNPPDNPPTDLSQTLGFGLLNKVKGIWNGPVTSVTALGSYPEWIVDFRPISPNQVSARNELDTLNDIHMGFFIAKYNNEYRLCFRNGGSFAGQTRVSYFLADSVSETSSQSYYRFSEILKGKTRAYTEVLFRSDSMIMKSYTNHYNTLTAPTIHMIWRAKLQDTSSCEAAINQFGFPQKTLTKDFSSSFTGQSEAIYYSIGGGDPYDETQHPYLGKATIHYTYSGTFTPDPGRKVFLIITTNPLISGFSLNMANLKYRSRYVMLSATDQSFLFQAMHPGTYYLYALYDADGNNAFSSGDWVSTANVSFTLANQGTVTASTQINFSIP